MIAPGDFPGGVWLVDFEFHPSGLREGNLPHVVCMVAREYFTGHEHRWWENTLYSATTPPFPVDASALFVAYAAPAEMGCFLALGWTLPANILDLYLVFRNAGNGLLQKTSTNPAPFSLLSALQFFGLPAVDIKTKETWRSRILQGGPWSVSDQRGILDYCVSDVEALQVLLPKLFPYLDLPRDLLRGRYTPTLAWIEHIGVPIDTATLDRLNTRWADIQQLLIDQVDQAYGVYQGTTFKQRQFGAYLRSQQIAWPRLASGKLALAEDTFRSMAKAHPQLQSLYELRCALGQMKENALAVGDDGRNRTSLGLFRAKTGRNQPSNTKFIFGPAVWLRGLIKPDPGWGIAYVDWSQQEFGIAAALSKDAAMMAAYQSGDPYLTFAKQAGAAPPEATKQTHSAVRDQFKQCVLAVQYGMGAKSLAYRIGQSEARATQLLELHRRTYRHFWHWSDGVLNQAAQSGTLWTVYGWRLHLGRSPKERTLRNFPMQANGAEMLRLACMSLIEDGTRICAPIHDAILIEAPLDELDATVARTQQVMREASREILGGFCLSSDAKVVRWPDRYMDERGLAMWNAVMALLGSPPYVVPP